MVRQRKRAILSEAAKQQLKKHLIQLYGFWLVIVGVAMVCALTSHSPHDVSFNVANDREILNIFGSAGAVFSDIALQWFGTGSVLLPLSLVIWGGQYLFNAQRRSIGMKVLGITGQYISLSLFLSLIPSFIVWDLPYDPAGVMMRLLVANISLAIPIKIILAIISAALFLMTTFFIFSIKWLPALRKVQSIEFKMPHFKAATLAKTKAELVMAPPPPAPPLRVLEPEPLPEFEMTCDDNEYQVEELSLESIEDITPSPTAKAAKLVHKAPTVDIDDDYQLPSVTLLDEARASSKPKISNSVLEASAAMLESILKEFGVRGEIVQIKPGPVVTMYELKPAAGIKTSRVIGLADDIARSMSALSARIAVIPGRNVIGIELPNPDRETVYLREMLEAPEYESSSQSLPLILGKDIGGAPIIADLARMPHLLVAGTTGSGKSVSVNTMILSLLYRLPPEKCRFIMVDPKMLELSVYDDIPHLLTPVVTDPKKAVVALKWAVKEMENRYRLMSKLSVRNIDGYNTRVKEAKSKGEILQRRVQTGFDPDTGKPVYENQPIDLEILPFIVIVVDEMADLMLVAGKEIEATVQRLAQMARAAGIHLIMATQRPSVDVITGTIKANFPTRISFQVTSKIDSRTILSEQGAEQLLGQGDMLYMMGGGRLLRVHGPFVSDKEVERIVQFLKQQAEPTYIDSVTTDDDGILESESEESSENDDLYNQAVQIVLSEGKASTSFIQRKLKIGYNRAARIIEEMEQRQIITPANHVGKREIIGM